MDAILARDHAPRQLTCCEKALKVHDVLHYIPQENYYNYPQNQSRSHALCSNQLPQTAMQEILGPMLPAVIFKNSIPTPKTTQCMPTTIF